MSRKYVNTAKKQVKKLSCENFRVTPTQRFETTSLHLTCVELCKAGYQSIAARSNQVTRHLIGQNYLNLLMDIQGQSDYAMCISEPHDTIVNLLQRVHPMAIHSFVRLTLLYHIGAINRQEFDQQRELLFSAVKQSKALIKKVITDQQKLCAELKTTPQPAPDDPGLRELIQTTKEAPKPINTQPPLVY